MKIEIDTKADYKICPKCNKLVENKQDTYCSNCGKELIEVVFK